MLFAVTKRNCNASCARARGAANAVNIAFGHVGQVKIDDMRDIVDINATRGNIGGDQQTQLASFKVRQSALALWLAFIAVNGAGADACFFKALYHLVSAMLCACEHKSAVDRWIFHQLLQQHLLVRRINKNNLLLNPLGGCGHRSNFDPGRIAQEGGSQFGNIFRHCGRKKHGLAARRGHANEFADIDDKAKIEHVIGFIEHQNFDITQVHSALVDEIKQPSWRCDQNIDAIVQCAKLATNRDAAIDDFAGELGEFAIGAKALLNLASKLAGWG